MADPTDVATLIQQLSVQPTEVVNCAPCDHVSPLWSERADSYYYEHIIDIVGNLTSSSNHA